MYALIITIIGAVLMTWGWSFTAPPETDLRQTVQNEVASVNFWSYQRIVSRYQHNLKIMEGHIADAQLAFDPNHIRDSNWTNVVQGGVLYVYSASPISDAMVGSILKRAGQSSAIGTVRPDGTFRSLSKTTENIVLPAGIPAGAIVVIGA